MGSILEINDSLQLTTEQGFPADLFDLERHKRDPITLAEIGDRTFTFTNKPGPRFFHLDPVRVFWFHNIGGRWLAWGHILIQEQGITRNPGAKHEGSANISDPNQWVTHGTYKVAQIYDPRYQKAFTRNDLPAELSYFGKKG
jgi:hypothetical protein